MNASAIRDYFYDSRRPAWVDGTTTFAAMIRRVLQPDMRILNLGAGPGLGPIHFDREVARVVGVDPDPAIASNRHLSDRARGVAEALPFRARSFDVVYSDWVVEHIADPVSTVREIARVLKPGGRLIFRTGNLLHYSYAISRLTPHRFHQFMVGDEYDPYPTYYRMNTASSVRRVMREAGLTEESLTMFESDPAYVGFSVPTMLIGVAYERLVNRFSWLAPLRANILACYQAPPS